MVIQTQQKERVQSELRSITTHCNDLKRENQTFREKLKKFGTLHNENSELIVQLDELRQATESLTEERDALRDNLQTTEAQVHCCIHKYIRTCTCTCVYAYICLGKSCIYMYIEQ